MIRLTPYTIVNDDPPSFKPTHAYVALSLSFNISFFLLHFSAVTQFAPAIGFAIGCGTIYLFSIGVR